MRSYCMLFRAHVLYYPEKGASLVGGKVGPTIEGNHSYWGIFFFTCVLAGKAILNGSAL